MSAIIRAMVPTANLTLLYGQLPLEARFEAARADGFSAVEILFPYDRSPQWYADRLAENDLRLVLVNTPVDPDGAPWGQAALPGQQAAFRENFLRVAELCDATGCRSVHMMAGCVPADSLEARRTLLENLDWTSAQYPRLRMMLEALNSTDVPGYFYSHPTSVISILESTQANAALQFDFYHVVKQGLDLLAELNAAAPYIGHVQVAGSPARNEPDLSRDGLLEGFRRLYESGYRGNLGYEYRPAGSVSEGLGWAEPLFDYFPFQSPQASRL